MTVNDPESRVIALKCLFSIACKSTSTFFASYQGWASLAFQLSKWDDYESGIIYIMFICILMNESLTRKIISMDIIESLQDWLTRSFFNYDDYDMSVQDNNHNTESKLNIDILLSHTASSQGALCVLDRYYLLLLAGNLNHDRSGELPAMLLLAIFRDSFRYYD